MDIAFQRLMEFDHIKLLRLTHLHSHCKGNLQFLFVVTVKQTQLCTIAKSGWRMRTSRKSSLQVVLTKGASRLSGVTPEPFPPVYLPTLLKSYIP